MLLETVTGKLVDVINPSPEQIDIEDIAWGLSRQPRFAGHTITPVPYNVAQHSIMVAKEIEKILLDNESVSDDKTNEAIGKVQSSTFYSPYEIIVQGLLHDAAEVYMGDLPSPVKRHPLIYNEIKKIENNLLLVIFDALNIAPPTADALTIIHYADMVARAVEAHAFMVSRGRNWEGMPHISLTKLQNFEQPWTSIEAYEQFKYHYEEWSSRRMRKKTFDFAPEKVVSQFRQMKKQHRQEERYMLGMIQSYCPHKNMAVKISRMKTDDVVHAPFDSFNKIVKYRRVCLDCGKVMK